MRRPSVTVEQNLTGVKGVLRVVSNSTAAFPHMTDYASVAPAEHLDISLLHNIVGIVSVANPG
jgi:hypothetical protein